MTQLIVFTRTDVQDYTYVCLPQITQNVFSEINRLVQASIDVDHYVLNLNSPRWLFWQDHNIWMWGVGCYKSLLCPQGEDRLRIRGFYGIISDEPRPMHTMPDLDYFAQTIFPEGSCVYDAQDIERAIEVPLPFNISQQTTQSVYNGKVATLNYRHDRIKTWACGYKTFCHQVMLAPSTTSLTMTFGLEPQLLDSSGIQFQNAFGPLLPNGFIPVKGHKGNSRPLHRLSRPASCPLIRVIHTLLGKFSP